MLRSETISKLLIIREPLLGGIKLHVSWKYTLDKLRNDHIDATYVLNEKAILAHKIK